jgi:hypothetical protein
VSTTIFPAPTAGIAASSTSTTSGEFGTQRIVTSLASTTARGSPASRAPKATAASIGPRLRDATATSCPASTRWRVIGSPIAPRPTNPTFIPPPALRAGLPPVATNLTLVSGFGRS